MNIKMNVLRIRIMLEDYVDEFLRMKHERDLLLKSTKAAKMRWLVLISSLKNRAGDK
jgi:hypothetical protein